MSVGIEAAFAALYARIKTVSGVNLFTRRLVGWDRIPQHQQPAVMLVAESASRSESDGLPAIWTLNASAWVLTPPDPSGDGAETTLIGVIDRIAAALDLKTTESGPSHNPGQSETTLGAVVFKAWVNGEIEIDAGIAGQQGVARIPISMQLPG